MISLAIECSDVVTLRRARLFVIAVAVLAGLWLGNDYGIWYDEVREAKAGEEALRAYAGEGEYFSQVGIVDHGPAYFMLSSASSRLIHALAPSWSLADGRHLTNYALFLLGVFLVYRLCLRLIAPGYAAIAAALFATQPLLFGHGFTNQKDVPFMTFFLGTVVIGMQVVDRGARGLRPAADIPSTNAGWRGRLGAEWLALSTRKRRLMLIALTLSLALLLDLFVFGVGRQAGASIIEAAYAGTALAPIQAVFSRIATDAHKTPIEAYLDIFDVLQVNVRAGITVSLAFAGIFVLSRVLPSIGEALGVSRMATGPSLLLAAVTFGLTISIRQVGAFAGLLVTFYLMARLGARGVFRALVYWSVAAATTIAAWPYLWPDPVGNFAASVRHAAGFPTHSVLFRGAEVISTNLPWDYFPGLASLQLTEPAVVLAALGLGAVIWRLRRGTLELFRALVLVGWVAVPVAALILGAFPAYGIRQLLFVFPPLLVMAGIGMEMVGTRLPGRWLRIILTLLLLSPGILGIASMHPYEYAYFNAFVGGTSGAEGLYDLDRWCMSSREATEYVNDIALPNSKVGVLDGAFQVEPFLRPDLKIVEGVPRSDRVDLVITCLRSSAPEWESGDFDRVYSVRRGQAVFGEVWRPRH